VKEILAVLLSVFVFVACMIWLKFTLEESRCEATAKMMGVDSHYSFSSRCLYKINGEWVPAVNYLVVEETEAKG
jgi:hypothetical protein